MYDQIFQAALKKLKTRSDGESIKLKDKWTIVSKELKTVSEILKQSEKTTIFAFIEGKLTFIVYLQVKSTLLIKCLYSYRTT